MANITKINGNLITAQSASLALTASMAINAPISASLAATASRAPTPILFTTNWIGSTVSNGGVIRVGVILAAVAPANISVGNIFGGTNFIDFICGYPMPKGYAYDLSVVTTTTHTGSNNPCRIYVANQTTQTTGSNINIRPGNEPGLFTFSQSGSGPATLSFFEGDRLTVNGKMDFAAAGSSSAAITQITFKYILT
jgi:hypothetical protein